MFRRYLKYSFLELQLSYTTVIVIQPPFRDIYDNLQISNLQISIYDNLQISIYNTLQISIYDNFKISIYDKHVYDIKLL